MPAFNSESFIDQAISSVLKQTHADLEILVINDCSTDKTLEIISRFNDERLKLFDLNKNHGVAHARNIGLENANGDFIAFCDSDDYWEPSKIEKQLLVMDKQKKLISHANALVVNSDGKITGSRKFKKIINFADMQYRNFVINSSSIVAKSAIGSKRFKNIKHEDYLFWLEIFAEGYQSVSCNQNLIYYRNHDRNLTKNKFLSLLWHFGVWRSFGYSFGFSLVLMIKNIFSRL